MKKISIGKIQHKNKNTKKKKNMRTMMKKKENLKKTNVRKILNQK